MVGGERRRGEGLPLSLPSLVIMTRPMLHVAIAAITLQVALTVQVGKNFGQHSEVHDEVHLKQHLEDKIDVSKMTPEQQKFYYFSMHDLNKDNRIDGIEILKALAHDHEQERAGPGVPVKDEDEMVNMIDTVLKVPFSLPPSIVHQDSDLNGDGFIDYAEYLSKQKN